MTITLFAPDGTDLGTAHIPPHRAFPPLVRVSPADGSHRFFLRRGSNVGSGCDQFDEVEPVEAEVGDDE